MVSSKGVAVAVTSYQRNEALAALVPHLLRLETTGDEPVQVVVVDNNPDGSAMVALAPFLDQVSYVHEPRPGIAAGRNAALRWAKAAGCRRIAFLDDDETPDPAWLAALLETADRHRAPAVTGPVLRDYSAEPSPYVAGMRRWDRVRRATGCDVPAASSANLLLDLPFLAEHSLQFDEAFGLSGGSDTLITRQIIQCGGRVVWSDDAVVIDHVTADRLTAQWLRKRGRRVGNTHSRVSLALTADRASMRRTRLSLTARGAALVAVGSVTEVYGRARGDQELAGFGAWRRSRGHGIVSGALGRVAYDYLRAA